MAHLMFNKSNSTEKSTFPLGPQPVVMGRHPFCEIRLNDAKVSREHTRIEMNNGLFHIEDLNSRNGTLLNGARLLQKQRLFNGDHINICGFEFQFCAKEPAYQRDPSAASDGSSVASSDRTLVFRDKEAESQYTVTSQIKLSQGSPTNFGQRNHQHLVDENASLRTKVRVLSELAGNLGKVVDSQELFQQFLDKMFVVFPSAETACLLTRHHDGEKFELISWASKIQDETRPIRVSNSMLEAVIKAQAGMLSDDVSGNSNFRAGDSMFRNSVSSIMAVPIFNHTEKSLIGVVQLDTTNSRQPFTHDDLDLLVSLSNQMGVYYENVGFYRNRVMEQMISQEMAVANKVQKGFLPTDSPNVSEYAFFDFYQPARYVGGDYFDYIHLPNGKIAIALADVSGKGISAALLMAKLSAEVRFRLLQEPCLTTMVEHLNQIFSEDHWENRFITFVIGVLDPCQHEIQIVNAGHVLPIVAKPDGTLIELDKGGGFPLGIVAGATYDSYSYKMEPGETLLFMSDGLTDAINSQSEYFGLDRVKELLLNHQLGAPQLGAPQLGAPQLGARLIEQIHQFVGNTPQSDDQCVILMSRKISSFPI